MLRYFFLTALALASAWLTAAYPATNNNEQRIVGGHEVDISLYPHQISLRYKDVLHRSNSYTHICGGSIIAAEWVVTAAHCILAVVPSELKIVAGTNYRAETNGVIVPVAEIIMHEYYNDMTYDNDIALLRLAAPLPLNNFTIKAIELADTTPLNGVISTITGWGTIEFGGKLSDTLLAVQVPIVSNELCIEDYGEGVITETMICAGVRGEGGKDACNGDSGGPLIIQNKLVGIVSGGFECALPDYPGIYSSVPYLLLWMKAKLEEAQCE